MTSGNFAYVPISSITIDRENRQRKEIRDVDELAKSIADNGLINPIVITRDNILVAGERRLTAHHQLGFDSIAVQYLDELDASTAYTIELEENLRRKDLDWKDRVAAVAAFHKLKSEAIPEWSQSATADAINISDATFTRYSQLNDLLEQGVEEVVQAPKLSTALNFAQRHAERKKTSMLRDMTSSPVLAEAQVAISDEVGPTPQEAPAGKSRPVNIICADFLNFAAQEQFHKYNLIHCDFPYGVNAGHTSGWSASDTLGGYEDTEEIYWQLLGAFLDNADNFIAESAHVMFWYSMDYHADTVQAFRDRGWTVNSFPLVWFKTDNTGIMPDPQRGPRRVYETALLCTRGDRKVVKPIANAFGHPSGRGEAKKHHMSEKPVPMLDHFFRMLVDEHTTILDPTCGSGNALKAAEAAGAAYALGLEINDEYVTRAKENLEL